LAKEERAAAHAPGGPRIKVHKYIGPHTSHRICNWQRAVSRQRARWSERRPAEQNEWIKRPL